MIGVIHAYSRSNAGDGMLVDQTLARLGRVGVGAEDVMLVALDPDSFPELPVRVAMGARGRGVSWELLPAAGRAIALGSSARVGRPLGAVAHRLAECDALIAVGGGYLRAVDAVSSVGTLLNHIPQLTFAGRSMAPSLYLPQSIGPLRGPVGSMVRRSLRRIDAVCVRDRWSYAELQHLPCVRRVPDLAILDVAEQWDGIEPVGSDGRVGVVARSVSHAPGYEDHLRTLAERFGETAVWAVQTAGDPTKSDAVHYEHLGVAASGGLPDLLERRELSVVISVRLHGALMAIRAGVPAIHLAYDRKGPSAFEDLGLDEWCFDVRSFDPAVLDAAVDRVLADPRQYWDRVAKRVPALQTASDQLDELVSTSIG